MADDMHECVRLGVSVLHIHARDENNKPTMRVDKFRETVRRVKERDPDVVIQISTGGRAPLDGVDPYTWRMDPLKLMQDLAERFRDYDIKPQVEVFDTNMISNANLL